MLKKELVSKDYIFKTEKGKLKFVGDFDGFYKKENDPWGQKGEDSRLKNYYAFSRKNLINTIKSISINNKNILEIGCGLGYVVNELHKNISGKITGMDISPTAIIKAKKMFPDIEFIVGDVCSKKLNCNKKFDVIIMNQLLWYILEKLPYVFKNIDNLLIKNGHLIFLNGFLRNQQYGKNIIEGFNGLIKYVLINHSKKYKVIKAEIDYSNTFLNYDGILLLKKNDDKNE